MSMVWDVYESPIGALTVTAGERGISGLWFPGRGAPRGERRRDREALAPAITQLAEYFAGERQAFDLELDLDAAGGSPFQELVWQRLLQVSYGEMISYGRLAHEIGRPDRAVAVGSAVGRTPVPIIVPCHRVIGSDGSLTGYGGGLHRKEALLDLEQRVAHGKAPEPAWAFRQLALL
jgi:methylated-DNA-[protein]-cysteine S-methyltransferase